MFVIITQHFCKLIGIKILNITIKHYSEKIKPYYYHNNHISIVFIIQKPKYFISKMNGTVQVPYTT